MSNFTQLGDTLILLSILSFLVFNTPRLWRVLILASIISFIFSFIFKEIFSVPRPAAYLDNDTFNIIGPKIMGVNSLPSGSSISVFSILTVLMFSNKSQKKFLKIFYFIGLIFLGLLIAFSRVAVGSNYPLDVFAGGIIGSFSALLAIVLIKFYNGRNSPIVNNIYYSFYCKQFFYCVVHSYSKFINQLYSIYKFISFNY